MNIQSFIAVTLLSFLLSGCSNLYLAMDNSSKPVDEDYQSRTLGSTLEDQSIETKTYINLKKATPEFKSGHIVVVSFNGTVLLAGQMQSEQLRTQAEEIAKQIRKVVRVHNALTVSAPISNVARTNDSWLTTKAKTRIAAESSLKGATIKVVTENAVIYLMGLVTRAQAEIATATVRQVYGAQKVVTLFEYVE